MKVFKEFIWCIAAFVLGLMGVGTATCFTGFIVLVFVVKKVSSSNPVTNNSV
ncbi:hypothetical protein [Bacillus sp. Au-Bac7]|uniref:hypothetical protein n=1 Tax=Bacillus sp. Au-Bac7 TaxID=2906458 RepID=UPI001E36393F|nr:hypothetical protein [Bacillus sp. Au-Bac7]MCE4048801.1 hypothetical protein [Bacillus sp. Au-Bac7]